MAIKKLYLAFVREDCWLSRTKTVIKDKYVKFKIPMGDLKDTERLCLPFQGLLVHFFR